MNGSSSFCTCTCVYDHKCDVHVHDVHMCANGGRHQPIAVEGGEVRH